MVRNASFLENGDPHLLVMLILEPLFYRGRGFTASDAVFPIIWRGFPQIRVILKIAALGTHLSTVTE